MADSYETIRTWIIRGNLKPGQRLLETQLAEQLGMSRTPVREALRRLEIEGLIQFAPNKGAVVKKYTQEELNYIFNLRVLLEGYAAEQAALNRKEHHCEEIASLNEEFETFYGIVKSQGKLEGQVDRFVAINEKFHHLIWMATGNPQLPVMLERIMVIPLVYKTYDKYSYEQVGNSLSAHMTIGTAIINRDHIRAEIAMKEHILAGRDYAFTFLSDRQQNADFSR
ncbi:GntR family transcriptional regulator [Neobacillus terrae]|uniref:GntR family transcriptional regulator n=1 Tax=Neobacillus terrae TaxID=3034837 RepID=UPI00140CA346|nr:GntR family transcriptional regulator [Neobacillus terrae]NHM33728.1 GntR family transcriptional regulator [Neobacillus terrae]